jgi:putative transposase
MPRTPRIVIPGVPHHITQRGNNREDVFFVDDDRRAYLRILAEESAAYGLTLHGFCLMTNHIHLIATPKTAPTLAKALGRTHWRYTQYVNRLHGRSGHLWQNRFFSCPLGPVHFFKAMAYVERNPLRAALASQAWLYPWSSAPAHTGQAPQTPALALAPFSPTPVHWKSLLRRPDDPADLALLRTRTQTGRPLGGDTFLSKLENKLGRRLRPLTVGRPRGKEK